MHTNIVWASSRSDCSSGCGSRRDDCRGTRMLRRARDQGKTLMLLHPEQKAGYPMVNDRQICMLLKSRLRSMIRRRILGWLKMKNCVLVRTDPVSRSCAVSYLAEPVLRDPPAAPPEAPPEELPDEPEDDPPRPPPPPPDPPPPLLFSR